MNQETEKKAHKAHHEHNSSLQHSSEKDNDEQHTHGMDPAEHEHDHMSAEHDAHGNEHLKPETVVTEEHSGQSESTDHSGHEGHGGHTDHSGHEEIFRRKFWVSLLLSIPVLLFSQGFQSLLGFSMPSFPGSQWIAPIFAVIVFLYGGLPFIQLAIPELRERKPGMMTLISLAIIVSFVYSLVSLFLPDQMDFFWELATLIDIMLLGHWIEMRSIRQASGALNALAKLMPDTAERIGADGQTKEVAVTELNTGDLLLIRPGSSIPADGEVEEGESAVNEAMITGESKPVDKDPGDKVVGGSINGDGSLRVRVTATGDQTALAGIMRMVQQAQLSKSRTQLLADRAAGWLFYIALIAAGITVIAWTIAIGFNVEVIERVATVLVIACPHALGLAIPLVVAITTAIGADNGILVRDRLALEKAREIDTVIFDKTGTLTEGKFGVVGLKTIEGYDPDEALALTAAVEGDSEHSIAQGIRRSAQEKALSLPEIQDFEAIKGRGIRASMDGRDIYVGGPRLLEMLTITLPEPLSSFDQESSAKGQSVVHLIKDDKAMASFALADVIRPESHEAIQRLHEMGLKVAMLTGDSKEVAQVVAEELGIDTFFAEVLPENKDQKVVQLHEQGQLVAMVGDGVNDAPALTRADVGIAIGSGTDVAVQSAGIILVKSNPLDVVKVIELSQASYKKMRQNLIWAAGYNVIAIPLAAGILAPWGILLSPAVGAILMSLSTIIVAVNAQLLRTKRF